MLDETIAFIEARKGGKKTKETFAQPTKITDVAKVTAYWKSKSFRHGDSDECQYCRHTGHSSKGSMTECSTKCPAYNNKCA